MNARFFAVAACVSSWLLAGSALAAGPFAGAGKSPAPQFHLADGDALQSIGAPPAHFLRARVGGRRRSVSHHGFPAAPPTGGAPATDTLMPLSNMDSGTSAPYRQSGAFRFDRHGGAVVREVSRSYHRMCDALSGYVWNQPDGKRICFDTRGKPGIAIQIPIN